MPTNRKSIILTLSVIFLSVLFIGIGVTYFYVPVYLEESYLPNLAEDFGVSGLTCNIRFMEATGVDIDSIRIGTETNPSITIDHVRIDYSPAGLFRKQIKSIRISGLNIYCQENDDKFKVAGFDLNSLTQNEPSQQQPSSTFDMTKDIPKIDSIQISNSRLVIEWNGNQDRIPFEIEIHQDGGDRTKLEWTVTLEPRGSIIELDSKLNLADRTVAMEIRADQLRLENYRDLLKFIDNLSLTGDTHYQGKVNFQYSPFRIISNTNLLQVTGLSFDCKYKHGELTVAGMTLTTPSPSTHHVQNEEENVSIRELLKMVSIQGILITRSQINIDWEGSYERIPLEAKLIPDQQNSAIYHCKLLLYLRGNPFSASAEINLDEESIRFSYHIDQLQLEQFSDILTRIPGLKISGKTNANGTVDFSYPPFSVRSVSTVLEFVEPHLDWQTLRIHSIRNAENIELPLRFEIASNDDQWEITSSSMTMRAPFPLFIPESQFSFKLDDGSWQVLGQSGLTIPRGKLGKSLPSLLSSLVLADPISIPIGIHAELTPSKSWRFVIDSKTTNHSTRNKNNLRAGFDEIRLTTTIPEFQISAQGQGHCGLANFEIVLPDVNVDVKDGNIKGKEIDFQGRSTFDFSERNIRSDSTYVFNVPLLTFDGDSISCRIPNIVAEGNIGIRDSQVDSYISTLNFENATVHDSEFDISAAGIGGRVPVQWPTIGTEKMGELNIEEIRWKNLNVGSLQSSIKQEGLGLSWAAKHYNNLFPGLEATLNGEFYVDHKGNNGELEFRVHEYRTHGTIRLNQYFPLSMDLMFSGSIEAMTNVKLNQGKQSGDARIIVRNGSFYDNDKQFLIEGFETDLFLSDIFQYQSNSQQYLGFTTANFGSLGITNGHIEYQVESRNSVFIEKSSFSWCNGSLNSEAFRINPGVEDYNVVLYCDRLKLAMVLEQFGIGEASGEGTVSGKNSGPL